MARPRLTERIAIAGRAISDGPRDPVMAAFANLAQEIATSRYSDFRRFLDPLQELFDLAIQRGFACCSIGALNAAVEAAKTTKPIDKTAADCLALTLGIAQGECHDFAAAIETIEGLLKRPEVDQELRRIAIFRLGSCYAGGGDNRRALILLRISLSNALQAGCSGSQLASIQVTLARALLEAGDRDEAKELAFQAIQILNEAKDQTNNRMQAASARDVLGKALELGGEYAEARRHFEDALALVRTHVGERHPMYAVALANLAGICGAQGHFGMAETLLDQAYGITAQALGEDHPQTIPVLSNLLLVRAETADDDGVERLLLALQERLSRVPSHPAALGMVWHRLGVLATKRKRFEEADAYLRKAAARLRDPPNRDIIHSQIARMELARGNLAEAQSIYEELAETHRSRHTDQTNECAGAILGLAEVALGKARWSEAIELAQKADGILRRVLGKAYPDRARCLEVMSCGHLGRLEHAKAAHCLRELAEVQGGQLLDVVSALSTRRQSALLRRFHRLLAMATGIDFDANGDSQCFQFAFEMLIQRKALSAEMAKARLSSLDRMPNHLQSEIAQLRDAYKDLALCLLQPEGASIAGLEDITNQRLDRRDALERSVSPTLLRQLGSARNLNVESLASSLPKGSACIDYIYQQRIDPRKCEPFVEQDTFSAYWVTSDGRSGVSRLGPFELLATIVSEFRDSLLQPDIALYRLKAERAYRALLGPLPDEVRTAQRLFISPDSILYYMPFGALSPADGLPLLASATITYVDSARDILSEYPLADLANAPEIVVPEATAPVIVGAPDYNASIATNAKSPVGEFKGKEQALDYVGDLPGAQRELDAIRQFLPEAIFWTGAQATKKNMVEKMRRPVLLHISTHGAVKELAKEFDRAMSSSYLALAGFNSAESGVGDGTLSGLEATLLDLRGCELVVLSGCETGLGRAEAGAGILGLRRGFRVAGARSQIVSLWQVHGEATAELMASFYRGLAKGLQVEESLRFAQLEFVDSGIPPIFWAGFLIFGPGGRMPSRFFAPQAPGGGNS
jgi:CHAT domain-containing protein/tetratricopeptide (TPR) repeat protein